MKATNRQRQDNLNIGLYLANARFGATKDQILQVALGYNPNGAPPTNYPEPYERRFRAAQELGRDAYRNRIPGYFTFNAMPFGYGYIYKALWYVRVNPKTRHPQAIPLPSGDLSSMRQLRDRDLDTRQATNRGIRAAHNIGEQRQAVARGDWQAMQQIQARMLEDGSLGEILSGYHGLEYADIEEVIPKLPYQKGFYHFQKVAKDVVSLERRLLKRKSYLAEQLTKLVMIQTGVPNNAHLLALQDAQQRLTALP